MTRAGFAFGWWLGITILAVWGAVIAFACGWSILTWWCNRKQERLSEERFEAARRRILARERERLQAEQEELDMAVDEVILLAQDADDLHRLRFYDEHDWGVRG